MTATAATTTATLRLGTRASALARTQSQTVADAISAATGRSVELVTITTEGDTSAAAIPELGGTGVFVTAIRAALLKGSIDLAVHSYKDLPTAPAPGLTLAAVPARQDPRDALVARDGLTLGELPPGSTVGTGAPRRVAQLRALGLGLEIVPIRGNVDTRLGRVRGMGGTGHGPALDAVVLARAGLARLDRLDVITETLDPLQVLPGPRAGRTGRRVPQQRRPHPGTARPAGGPGDPRLRHRRAQHAGRAQGRLQRPGGRLRRDRRGRGRRRAVPPRLGDRDRRQRQRPRLAQRPTAGGRRARAGPGHRTSRPRCGRAHGGQPVTAHSQTPTGARTNRARIRSTP